jgi:uncharacterized membrane protein
LDAEVQQVTEAEPGLRGHSMEMWISHVLRFGVILAAAIILLGLVVFVVMRPSSGPTSVHQLLHSGEVSVSPHGIFHGVAKGDATSLIQLGVLTLILTPIMRVAMSIALFSAERDGVFVLITSIVLAVLVAGLTGII